MTKILERQIEDVSNIVLFGQHEYSGENVSDKKNYSTFAEMYLEERSNVQSAGITASVCTWRAVPTIDDW